MHMLSSRSKSTTAFTVARALERPARNRLRIAIALIVVVSVASIAIDRINFRPARDLALTSGPPGGVWFPMAKAITEVASSRSEYPALGQVRVLDSTGHRQSLKQLLSGEADFAFFIESMELSDDVVREVMTLGDRSPTADVDRARIELASQLRVVARLHEEVLQVVVRAPASGSRRPTMLDLIGKRVGVGSLGNGTESILARVFRHFTAQWPEPAEGQATYTPNYTPHRQAAALFRRGELDAVAIAAGLHADIVDELLRVPNAQLVSLGSSGRSSQLAGFTMRNPDMIPRTIPASLYGAMQPRSVTSVAARTLLVTRASMPDPAVEDFVRAVFDNRSALVDVHEAASLFDADPSRTNQRFPWHPGALAYYDRNAPSWLLSYAELMNFGLALLVALGSLAWVVGEWRRQTKKNRIDVYYMELAELAEQVNERLSLEALEQCDRQFHSIRRRAFNELVAERLEAGASFLIFQQFLNAELDNIDRLRVELLQRPSPASRASSDPAPTT